MTLDTTIFNAKLLQDIELASAIKELKKNPSQLQSFLQNQQDSVYKNIVSQKDNTFQKVYGDMNRSQNVQESILRYNQRSKELSSLQDNIYKNQKSQANAVVENKNTYGRKYEMNEWTVGNKKDTLFVFSALFVALSVLVLITVLLRMNLISSTLWMITGSVTIIIFILIILNRAQYTDQLRNKRYWNKRNFDKNKRSMISVCPTPAPTSINPGMPGMPGMPGTPTMPGVPGMSGVPSMSSMPGMSRL